MLSNGCFSNIITANPPLLGWHRTPTLASLETPPSYCHLHLRCFTRCAAATHPVPDHLLLSESDSDSDWALSPHPNPNPNSTATSSNSGSKGSTAGFTRLKAKRVKALVKRIKQEEINTCDDDRRVSRGESFPKNSEPVGSFAAPHLRGWADGGSIRNPKLKSPHHLNKHLSGTDFFSRKTFANLGCSEYMIKSLKEQDFLRPSHIQAKAFGPVIEGHSCIIADQSGSGKTLAYLTPVVQRLREEELQGVSRSSSGSPRAVIIVPTAELASQVLNSCRSLSKSGVPFRSLVVTGGFRQKTQLENLEQSVDVLIATPGRFMFLIKEGYLQLENLRSAVFDEVDILFNDEDFKVALQSLIDSAPVVTQYLFVTATLPIEIYNRLVEVFPDTKVIMGPGMHHISSGLEEVLVDCSGEEGTLKTPDTAFLNKKNALLKLVEESPVPKTIVFCNKIETCRKVENVLKRFDRKGTHVRVLPFHAALSQETRLINMKEFTHSQPGEESLILVCTDRASRGIDFSGVDHVVLFDYPRDPSEYVRRVGRTARGAWGTGKAFIFVIGKQVPLARKIIERNQKGHPLHEVPAAF
ncbi:DEAD-box ATP-dependent RNA helicase 50 [Hibiscus syriacus]|uniref:DEAD-box ATP-dependent RNA helicase 50 n=1 Tax=Hibiscus syriacus TaxID=106335 RepID=A0A6A3C2K2_HIBSY|nr:DEAD-box ATP-dependent RNA helicase 50 [Hibiscus syriacus]KAE8723405.1 DEAD-box ATP-dependent RNA helicase 50 [Hibiscus syriacus]